MRIELSEWLVAFPASFEAKSGSGPLRLYPSERSSQLIHRVSNDPDSIWLLSFEERALLLPFMLHRSDDSGLEDTSGILGDYMLMLMTPASKDHRRASWWTFVKNLESAKKTVIAETLFERDGFDVDDLKYPGYKSRKRFWERYLKRCSG